MADIEIDIPADGIKRLTLNRPDALNSLTFDMYRELIDLFSGIRHDPSVRVVILTGAGRAFCAGHDVRGAGSPDWVAPDQGSFQMKRSIMSQLGSIPVLMRSLPQPVIVAVNGAAAGAGYSLALAADMTLMAKSAKFVNAYHNAGTGHEFGLSYLLPRIVGLQRAAELLLTARPVFADEAAEIGMVLRVVPDDELQDAALALAGQILLNSPIGTQITKQTMRLNEFAGSLEAAIEMENRGIYISQATADSIEKRKAFAERRPAAFTGK
jgi:enoyl-CoA hydratase